MNAKLQEIASNIKRLYIYPPCILMVYVQTIIVFKFLGGPNVLTLHQKILADLNDTEDGI